MSADYTVDQVTADEWSALASTFTDNNIYQTWAFGEVRARESGATVSRLVLHRDGQVVGAAQVRIKQVPIVGVGLAYVYYGPLWRRRQGRADDFLSALQALRHEYGSVRGHLVRVVPNLPMDSSGPDGRSALANAGFQEDRSHVAYRTIRLDLRKKPEELRAGLGQKWRNKLKQSEKASVRVECRIDEAAMGIFEALYGAMRESKRFETGVKVDSFREIQRTLPESQRLRILLAYAGDNPVAGHVSSTLGDTCINLLRASNELGRECNAAYLLQWHAIEAARAGGAHWYDLGGIDPVKNPGVYQFKAGQGGTECSFVGQFELPPSGSARFVISIAERAYRALRPAKRIAEN